MPVAAKGGTVMQDGDFLALPSTVVRDRSTGTPDGPREPRKPTSCEIGTGICRIVAFSLGAGIAASSWASR